ncbi:MAG TPA: HAMP domain-containing protein, partial [Vicinamibacterales bacterium]|nr:HAMP domain-containing protein [Vicinamibacterales bacterium]
MESDHPASSDDSSPNRHTVAKWAHGPSLRVRLLLFVGLIAISVVSAVSYFEVRSFALTVQHELDDTVVRTTEAVANDLDLRQAPLDPLDIRDRLHDFAEADAVIRSISVVTLDSDGRPEVFASTSSEARSDVVALASRSIKSGTLSRDDHETLVSVALPLATARDTAVVTVVSLESVQQARARGRAIAFAFALPTILLVTLLVDFAARQLVHRPLAEIQHTIEKASRGALDARAAVIRADELGSVAEGLNQMLDRLEHFNEALRERVREATAQLEERNIQLADSYSQMLTLREVLSRSERLAALG